jgi:Flp pilus assembly protein protease CpaA
MFEVIRLVVMLVFYGIAAFKDYKTMTVKNWVFATPFVVGLCLAFFEGLNYPVVLVLIQCVLFYAVWRLKIWGGGDAKALMSLALLAPNGPFNNTPGFVFFSLWFACLLAVPKTFKAIKNNNYKKLQIPLLTYLIAGIVLTLIFGETLVKVIM